MKQPEYFRVVLTDYITEVLPQEWEVLGDIARLETLDARCENDLVGRVETADALILFHGISLSRRTLDRLERCRVIARCGVGIDNVDHVYARQRGIAVANVPDYGTEEVADSALGMTLALARGIARANSQLRAASGAWSHSQVIPLRRLRGEVFGIVGLGRIGSATALRAKALGMDVMFYDPYKADGYDKALGVRRVWTFDELCARSYVLSLHCPLTVETRKMVNGATLATMRAGCYLVNTARGGIVDTAAIPTAIASGQLAGAAIDVLPEEPPSDDDPLIRAWRDPAHPAYHRVLINPHSAFYCEEGLVDMRVKAAQACRQALLGQPVRNVVN
jgi:D-3-phosphoglycerate dehydrogenase/C-terminal binding protein